MESFIHEDATLSIHEVARRSGLAESTLRYYEKIGLIAPIARDHSSRHRRYSQATSDLIEALSCLRAAGMSLADMRRYLNNMKSGKRAAADQRALFEQHRNRIEEQIYQLQKRQAYLDAKVMLWSAREDNDSAQEAVAVDLLQKIGRELRENV